MTCDGDARAICTDGEPVYDVDGIYLTKVCSKCKASKLEQFRPDVLREQDRDTDNWQRSIDDMRQRMQDDVLGVVEMPSPSSEDGDQPSYLQELTWRVAYDALYESTQHHRPLQEVIAETIDEVLQAETARLVEEEQEQSDGVKLCLRLLMGMRSYPDAQVVNSLIPSRADWRSALRSAAYVLLFESAVEEIKTRLLQAQPLSDWLAWREYCNAAADIQEQEEDKDQ